MNEATLSIKIKVDDDGKIKVSSDQIKQFGDEAEKAGEQSKTGLSMIDQAMSTAFGMGAIQLIGKAGAAIQAFARESIAGTFEYAESIEQLSRILGTSAEDTSNLASGLKIIGVSTEKYASDNQKLSMQIKGNEEYLQKLGITTRDQNNNLLAQNQIFKNSIATMLQYKEGTDRNQFAMNAFGRSAQEVMVYQELTNEVMGKAISINKTYGLSLTSETIEKTQAAGREIEAARLVLKGVSVTIGEWVIPKLAGMATGLETAAGWWKKLYDEAEPNVLKRATDTSYANMALNMQAGADLIAKTIGIDNVLYRTAVAAAERAKKLAADQMYQAKMVEEGNKRFSTDKAPLKTMPQAEDTGAADAAKQKEQERLALLKQFNAEYAALYKADTYSQIAELYKQADHLKAIGQDKTTAYNSTLAQINTLSKTFYNEETARINADKDKIISEGGDRIKAEEKAALELKRIRETLSAHDRELANQALKEKENLIKQEIALKTGMFFEYQTALSQFGMSENEIRRVVALDSISIQTELSRRELENLNLTEHEKLNIIKKYQTQLLASEKKFEEKKRALDDKTLKNKYKSQLDEINTDKEMWEKENKDRFEIERITADRIYEIKRARWNDEASAYVGAAENLQTVAGAFGEKGFATAKALSLAIAAIKTPEAAMSSFAAGAKIGGPYVGAIFAAIAVAAQLAQMAQIKNTSYTKAHTGWDYIPKEMPVLLDRGEGVLNPKQNVDLSGFLADYFSAKTDKKTAGRAEAAQIININMPVIKAHDTNDMRQYVNNELVPMIIRVVNTGKHKAELKKALLN